MKVYNSLISNVAAGILLAAAPASSARHSIRRHATAGGGIESDTDTHHSTKDRSLLDDMSMSMPQDLTQLNDSDSGTLILSEEEVEALLKAASNQGYNIDKFTAMDVLASLGDKDVPAHHHGDDEICKLFLVLLFKKVYYHHFWFGDKFVEAMVDKICGGKTTTTTTTTTTSTTTPEDPGIFGSVATTSCSATVVNQPNQSKVGFNASRQFMNTKQSWQILGQQYSTCSASTLTSLKFFDIPGWSGDLSMSDMDAILTANPNVKTVIVAVPQNKLGTTFKSAEATQVVAQMKMLRINHTGIKFILAVGNEPFENGLKDVHDAMVLLYAAMSTVIPSTIIPMSTPLSAAVFQNSFPPGNDFFTDQATMKHILDIVFQSNGPFMVNRYPYFDILANRQIELNCALGVNCFAGFVSQFEIDILASRFAVTNLYNEGGDEYLYFSNKDNFYVTETGWPSCGGGTFGSNTNLITYNKNAIRDVETGGALEDVVGKVFLFEAHDEENKGGGVEEGCFGLMDENGTPKN